MVPAPPPAAGDAEPLAAALLPVVLHRLNNATQLLMALRSLAAVSAGDGWIAARAPELARAGQTVDELGYLLAVVSSAAGADLLLERRRPDGIELLLALVGESLHREGRGGLRVGASATTLDPGAGRGWELPWAAGVCAQALGRSLESPALELESPGPGRLRLRMSVAARPAMDALLPCLRSRLASAEIEERDDELRMELAVPMR